jgi:hypothetical protein
MGAADMGGVDIAVNVYFQGRVHGDHAQAADNAGVVGNLLGPKHDTAFKKIHVVSDPVFDQHLKGIRNLVADVLLDMGKTGKPVPEPIAIKHFSGKFMVRVPPEIHRKLAIQAAESGISLNRIASSS